MNKETSIPSITEAAIKYPRGTRFNSTGGYVNREIRLNDTFECDEKGDIKVMRANGMYVGRVYSHALNKWADIVFSPTSKESVINNTFPIY